MQAARVAISNPRGNAQTGNSPWTRGMGVLLVLAFLAGCASAPIQRIQVQAELPELSGLGSGQLIVVGPIQNVRNMLDGVPNEPGRWTHWRRDLQDQCADASVGEFFCIQGTTPEELLRDELIQLLTQAGFKVSKDPGKAGNKALLLSGELRHFYFLTERPPTGFVPGLARTRIDLTLQFSKGEELLAEKKIGASLSGRPYAFGPDRGVDHVAKYLTETLDKAMGQTAAYLASDSFQEDVLGLSPGQLRKADLGSQGAEAASDDEDDGAQ